MLLHERIEASIEAMLPDLPGGRLPAIRRMARDWKVSTRTIQAALLRLRERSLVEARPGSGLWAAGKMPAPLAPDPRKDAATLAAELHRDIDAGMHPWRNPLPSAKEWASRWRCHEQTAAKALRLLVSSGVVRRQGRLHFPASPRSLARSSAPPSLLCVGASDESGGVRMDSDRELDFWHELGATAAEMGIGLSRHPWDGERIRTSRETIGVIASTWHVQDPFALYRRLNRIGLPACVWVEDPTFRQSLRNEFPKLHFHDQGYGTKAGAAILGHLAALGHRRIVWLSPWQASIWSRNRLGELLDAAREAGGIQVEAFTRPGLSEWDRLGEAWSDSRSWKDFPTRALEDSIEGNADRLHRQAIMELGWNRIRADFAPLAQAALDWGATAWVGANDAVATLSIRWLRERGIGVPEEISVCGFDDTSESLRADLSSFRFDTAPMVRAMVRQILVQEPPPTLTHHRGFVVPRRSTRRVDPERPR